MLQLRWFHHFKALLFVGIGLFLVGACAGFVWLNDRGFEGKWGERIAAELSRRGIHAEFESVRFSPTRGIIAKKVIFYTDESRSEVFARIPLLRFDVDRGKAFRGELQIRRVILHDAHLSVPVSSDGSLTLQITKLTGSATLDRQNRLLLENARGTLGGMNFHLDVELDEFELTNIARKREPKAAARRDDFARDVLAELARWSFPGTIPPELSLRITGSVQRPASIRTSFSIAAEELTRRDYTMENLLLTGEFDNRTLTIDELTFSDGSGNLQLRAHYDLQDKTGAYNGSSSIKIADLLRKALDNHTLDEFISAHAPVIEAQGEFGVSQDEGLQLTALGKLEWEYFRFLGIPLDKLNADFSWQNGNIFLRNLVAKHEVGELSGQILLQDDMIRYRTRTSLPLSAYRAFIRDDSGLDHSLARSNFTPRSKVSVEAEGTIQRSNLRVWDATGKVLLENFSYNGVPMIRAAAAFYMTPLDSIFTNVQVEFSYASYERNPLAGLPPSGTMHATKVHYDAETGLTHIDSLQGTAWPGPILRLFAPGAANHVEKHYGFQSPPDLSATGVIDVRSPATRTDMVTQLETSSATTYQFLGQTLQLDNLSATVRTRHHLHDINNLHFDTLGGTGEGMLSVQKQPAGLASVSGGIGFEKINLAEVGKTYGFSNPSKGSLTAHIDFKADEAILEDGKHDWQVEGQAAFKDSSVNEVPILRATANFDINSLGSNWTKVETEFDYASYVLRRRYGGPRSAVVRAESIRHDKKTKLTHISNLRGTAWPGPVLRLIVPDAADHVDESYGFRSPPSFTTSGVADHRRPGTRTDLRSRIEARGTTECEFLDRTLQLAAVSATVRTRHQRHDVANLEFRTFRGSGAGEVTVQTRPGHAATISGGIKWNDLSLADIGQTYNFEKAAKGSITGRIDFTTSAGNVRSLNGRGVMGLRDGQLFHVPIFGPLSLPIGGILGKKFSHEQARDASATFVLKDGVAYTNDFLTSTPSTVFAGEGNINLATNHIDMIMRMNARGLLGLVTLPLLPLNGLFQFRGQGPLKKPVWRSAPFTQPAGGQKNPIFRDPPRAQIVPER